MRRASLSWAIAGCMVALVFAVTLIAPLTGSYRAGGLVGLALGAVFSAGLSWRMRRDIDRVRAAVQKLAVGGSAPAAHAAAEFTGTYAAIARASGVFAEKLGAAAEDRRKLESVLDSMQDAVVAVDAAGRILWTNQRMQRLIPGGAAGALGSGAVRVGHALVQTIRDPEVLECVRTALDGGGVCVRRSTSLAPGRIFEVNAAPMPGGGAVAVLHDVTRMEEVEQTQRDFVANVSHELRTPLTSITGYVETLLDGGEAMGMSAEAREFLGTILKNATRMNRLTEDLLVMARVEAPTVALRPGPVPADTLVEDAVSTLSGLVQESAARVELGEMTTTQVYADADAVMQVLGNLIENAVKYGQPRSGAAAHVVIRAREVSEPYDAVEFSVQDFGAGIASEHLDRIFERFYRVDKTRSRESGGTGLGLAIARYMVRTQGGSIWAESELGVGSTFLFTLPKALYPIQRQAAENAEAG